MTETSLPPVIRQMLKPDFYPHPAQEPIHLEQTHVSYVLLTGEYAYKLKKPVNFGFLDFSTLELRRHFCQEELRMNQRGAPDLYLEVVAISQDGDRFYLGEGEGEVVEYAVKMRQFPQEALFSGMFEKNELTEELMQRLGQVVAEFHGKSATNDYIRSFGQVSQIREAFDQNYEQSQKYIGGPQTQQWFDQTQDYSDRFFAERQDLFESRIQNHRIRECHGDLHARNISLWQDKIVLFDCIEFNEPFRFVDVMYDVAFAVMDLEARGRQDLGNAFLNTYIEQTGDWEGLQLLPLYLSRQAYVRAKVTSFLLDDPAVPEPQKAKASQTASEYYKLAWEYTQQKQGQVILMSGVSGSGKSTVARKLARKLGAIHLRSDAVRKHLAGIPLTQRGGDDLYTPEMSQKTYNRLLELGLLLASQGFNAILDAKYDRVAYRESAIARAKEQGLSLRIINCIAPVEVLRERLEQRTGDIADATADLLESQLAALEPYTAEERHYVTSLDTSQDLDEQVQEVYRQLSAKPLH
ncbi:AAA family ATPase [Desertifilum sp. FACHB-1129]|uniref:gluconokinase n=1 Tax=Desertifilum tharense IPPAS B-1220 TaxID=1781255 RepID=A0A1E5QN03_9CYAN|nr:MULTISPECIES: AAA family ATPase [Desertifilum]MDA0213075.1 AAA family ATPase [Cyanobacteria bacterium FC1]MBD2312359.1 AAA family ATPase [Desertifilum sp. FACHB-1129]MBD2321142.1 AAA family ATPase [Desertifilum sp. FACHB-866]MBD2331551.1 AAA family ATPase [Desertifilum sp. FACHB-868]OEJ76062.1 adenylyl-sulfate kinase [Desertifilum tharense IPPAS B-1220]